MSTPLLRSNLSDLYLATALPSIEFIVQEKWMSFDPVYEKVFNVDSMKYSISQSTQISALSPAGQVGEGQQIPTQNIEQGYDQTYVALKYGIMLATSEETIKDERYDVLSKNPARLARSFNTTTEIIAATIFNNGFSAAGPDGQALFSTAHPLIKPTPTSATSSNRLAVDADLSMTTLKNLATLFRGQLDSAGNKLNIPPKYLLVPKELEFLAYELCKSVMLPDSANANVNAVNSVMATRNLQPLVWDYLTDTNASFLVGDQMDTELHYYWRERPAMKSEIDFKTEVALTKMTARMVAGFSDWRGVVGTSGSS